MEGGKAAILTTGCCVSRLLTPSLSLSFFLTILSLYLHSLRTRTEKTSTSALSATHETPPSQRGSSSEPPSTASPPTSRRISSTTDQETSFEPTTAPCVPSGTTSASSEFPLRVEVEVETSSSLPSPLLSSFALGLRFGRLLNSLLFLPLSQDGLVVWRLPRDSRSPGNLVKTHLLSPPRPLRRLLQQMSLPRSGRLQRILRSSLVSSESSLSSKPSLVDAFLLFASLILLNSIYSSTCHVCKDRVLPADFKQALKNNEDLLKADRNTSRDGFVSPRRSRRRRGERRTLTFLASSFQTSLQSYDGGEVAPIQCKIDGCINFVLSVGCVHIYTIPLLRRARIVRRVLS